MDTEDVAVDNGSEWQEVEGLIEIFPAIGIAIFFIDFVQETVHHSNVPTFVVAPEEVDAVGIFDLKAE